MNKKFNLIIVIAALLFGCSSCGNNSKIIDSTGDEFNTYKIYDSIKIGWNLGNSLDAYPKKYSDWVNAGSSVYSFDKTEKSWGNPLVTQDLISFVKKSGFNSIRIPITWFDHIDQDNVIDQAFLDRTKEVVDYCISEDLTCIINVHHDTGEKGWLFATENEEKQVEYLSKFADIWKQIANFYTDYSVEKLMFEGFNEILDDNKNWNNSSSKSLNFVNDLNQQFVDTVRSTNGNNLNRVLIVNTYAANLSSSSLDNFIIPKDTKENMIIAQVHAYTPWNFASGNSSSYNRYEIDNMFSQLNQYFVNKNIPVIIGEFGVKFTNENRNNAATWANYYVSSANKYNIKCYLWDDGKSFKLIDREKLVVDDTAFLTNLMSPFSSNP